MQYSYAEIETIKQSIDNALKQKLNKDERFCFLKNLKLCKKHISDMNDLLLDNDEKYMEYNNKIFKAQVDAGAKIENLSNGKAIISDTSEMDVEKAEKEMKKLSEDYSEAIEKQKEIYQENIKIKEERKVEVDWFTIGFDKLEDNTNEQVLNENTLDFIDA